MSHQDANMSPKQTPSVQLPVTMSPGKSPWDANTDEDAMNANETGKTVP